MITLLVLSGAFLTAFVLIQVFLPATATIPPRIFCQRSILAASWASFCIGSQMIFSTYFCHFDSFHANVQLPVYYLPIWFQAIKDVSPIDSGIYLLPLILPMFIASILSGALTSRIGYYTPFMICGNCLMAVGAGMLTTLQVDTEHAKWIGYQVLYGFGLGNTLQAPNLAAQTVLKPEDIPVGTALMIFSQQLGGAIFVSVGQNVLSNQLARHLEGLQGFNPGMLTNAGATTFINQLSGAKRDRAVAAYNDSLRTVFQVGLIIVCLTLLGSLGLEWKSVKKAQKPAGACNTVESKVAGENTDLEDKVDGGGEK